MNDSKTITILSAKERYGILDKIQSLGPNPSVEVIVANSKITRRYRDILGRLDDAEHFYEDMKNDGTVKIEDIGADLSKKIDAEIKDSSRNVKYGRGFYKAAYVWRDFSKVENQEGLYINVQDDALRDFTYIYNYYNSLIDNQRIYDEYKNGEKTGGTLTWFKKEEEEEE